MSRDEIVDLITTANKKTFDSLINKEFNLNKDFDGKMLKEYLKLARISHVLKKEELLRNLGVFNNQRMNNAGILFFSREPQKFFPQSVYTTVVFRDIEGADVIQRKEISGSLFEIVKKVMEFVEFYVKVAYKFTGRPQRENIYEYPLEAIREAVINSVMHKDYFESGHNNILKIFPDRIQIENIWKRPKYFKLGETVFRRNPIVANLFARIHFGEKLGSGFARIREHCREEKAPYPKIKLTDTHFYVAFQQNTQYMELAGTIKKKAEEEIDLSKLNIRQRKSIGYLKEHKSINITEYIGLNKVSDKTARRDLSDLTKRRIIIKEGITANVIFKLRSTSVKEGAVENDVCYRTRF